MRSDFRVQARGGEALFRERGVVVAMDDVVRDAGMMGVFLEERFQDFTAAAIVRKVLSVLDAVM